MSDYARIRSIVEVSEYSDYHEGLVAEHEYTMTPDEWQPATKVDALVAGTTIELGNFTTVTAVVVVNTDTTNFVTVAHTYGGTANSQYLPAQSHIILHNPTIANDIVLTADTATCICKVWIFGT